MGQAQEQPATTDRLSIRSSNCSLDKVVVRWRDGHESRFPAIWLRHNCTCAECGSTETGRRHLRLTDVPADVRAQDATIDRDGNLEVSWAPEGHRSLYSPAWLRGNCLSASEREYRRFKPPIWHPEVNDLVRYESLPSLQDKQNQLRYLERLRDYGFVVLTDVPAESGATETAAATVGLLRITNYGVYELISRPNPQLAGDTSVALAPHTDEPYRQHPPGITFFHVLVQSDEGGDSILIDGLHVAETLRSEDPEAFRLLSSVPVDFHRVLAEGRIFRASAPIIRLDQSGNVSGLRLLDRGTAPFDLAENEVDSYYRAYRKLLSILYDKRNCLVVKILPGQVLVFNNQRLLHGRTAFDGSKSLRHVRTANVDLDEFYSSLRVLYREFGREELYMRLPQGAGT